MHLKSLKGKLLVTVSTLVIGSCLLISLLVTQRYSKSLLEATTAQAQNVAHAVALQAADEILINDLVSLQKMLDHHLRSNQSIAYLFTLRDGRILAHTFKKGVPARLPGANVVTSNNKAHFQKIVSTTGERYLDIAWPIFEGKGGTLRMGFSEALYRQRMARLWLEMGAFTFGILVLALIGVLLFARRVTRPLASLTEATQRIDAGQLGVRVSDVKDDEVGLLASSFNRMVARIEDYTNRLEEQTMELDRAHQQTRLFCSIVKEIGALQGLNEMGAFLIKRFKGMLPCDHEMVLLFFSTHQDLLFISSPKGLATLGEPERIRSIMALVEGQKGVSFADEIQLPPTVVPDQFLTVPRFSIIPLHHEHLPLGALLIANGEQCHCRVEELEPIGIILSQAAGVIRRAIVHEEESRAMQNRLEVSTGYLGITGRDPKMQMLYRLIDDIAPTDATVLIQGESGTGKELMARAIHQRSIRKGNPFVVINCSAYPATLLESELFGHEKGAFTGAIRQKSGRFEQADRGTAFLDEIGEIPPPAQIKLLRVLQTRKFERLGGEKTLSVDVRIIAATNKELLQEVKNGNFREDLFYRLNVIPINLPPLRDRRDDITLLAQHFLHRFATEQRKDIEGFSSEVMRLLLDYSWPGNVRELENSVEHAVVLAKSTRIEISDLPSLPRNTHFSPPLRSHATILENEKTLLREVLEECDWNKKQAAQRLGISRSTLYGKLRKYQILNPTIH